jgi:Spy/CpxP family protein refolding chaperone
MIKRGRAILMMAALLGVGGLLQAQETPAPGPGQAPGQGFGFHRPPMERALGPMGTHGRWWNNPDVAQKLNLTDDQKQAMDQILLAHREKLVDLRGNLEKAELQLEPLMQADQPNEAQVLAQIDAVAQARAELEKANARFLLALRTKLSSDQWKQLQTMRQEHRQMRMQGPGAMHRPGTPPPPSGPGGPGGQSMLVAPFGPQFEGEFMPMPGIGTAD